MPYCSNVGSSVRRVECLTRQIPDPDVVFLITNLKRDASPIGVTVVDGNTAEGASP